MKLKIIDKELVRKLNVQLIARDIVVSESELWRRVDRFRQVWGHGPVDIRRFAVEFYDLSKRKRNIPIESLFVNSNCAKKLGKIRSLKMALNDMYPLDEKKPEVVFSSGQKATEEIEEVGSERT